MTFHKADCGGYVKSGKNLRDETIKSLTDFFQALFVQKKIDGMLKHAKMNWLCLCTKQHIANNICEKHNRNKMSYMLCGLWERMQCDNWLTTDAIMAAVDASLDAMNATIRKKATAKQWASAESTARGTIVKRQCQRSHGHGMTSADKMKKASVTITKDACVTKCMQLTTSGQAPM